MLTEKALNRMRSLQQQHQVSPFHYGSSAVPISGPKTIVQSSLGDSFYSRHTHQNTFWCIYFLLKSARQHPKWTWKQSLFTRIFRAFIQIVSFVRLRTPCDLNPRKEKERFIVMPPAQETLYTGIITADPEIRPTKIGGTWYPSRIDHANPPKDVVLHFHGGGYTLGDGRTADCGFGASIILKHTSVGHVFCPQYRLSANTGGRFPAALQDALTSYAYLIFDLAILPSNIILSGDSAGGHMALQLLRYISDHGAELGLPPPQCAWL